MLKKIAAAAAFAALSVTGAMAAQNTGTLNISATIDPTCTVNAGSALSFGSVGSITADIDPAFVNIVLTCNAGTVYTVGLGVGNTPGATETTRAMPRTGGGGTLPYFLYSDSGRSANFPDIGTSTIGGTAGSSPYTFGGNEFIRVYGRITGTTPTPAPGAYTDAVTITVQF